MQWKQIRLNKGVLLALAVSFLAGCANKPSDELGQNLVTSNPAASQTIGDAKIAS